MSTVCPPNESLRVYVSVQSDFFLPEEEMVHLRRRQEALRRQSSLQSGGGVGVRPLSRLGTLRERLSRRISSASVTPPGQTQ